MLSRVFNRITPHRQTCLIKYVQNRLNSSDKTKNQKPGKICAEETSILGDMATKYRVFQDKDSEEVLDVYEERHKYKGVLEDTEAEEEENPFEGINLERGLYGVYDIEDLVDVLQRENGQDIFVALVAKEIKYVDYMCLVTGKSYKHMSAIAQFVRKVYKQKRHESDFIPRLEGKNSRDWMAIDLVLGNIALHIFSTEGRKLYDLDSLWSVGPQFDEEFNKEDPVSAMLEKHSYYLQNLQPAS